MWKKSRCLLFDWGDTLMKVFPQFTGPMCRWPAVDTLPGARESLALLHPEWTIALATNAEDSSEQEIRDALARCKLEPYVDRIYSFRRIGHRKPSRQFFQFILDDLALTDDLILMIGDDFESDVLGANRAGIRAVWLNPNTPEARTSSLYRTIHDLAELPGLLKNWPP